MYGMVNRAMEALVMSHGGESAWVSVIERAGLPHRTFSYMQTYPDAETYALVGAASEFLGLPVEELLRNFGRYWIRFAADNGYGELLGAHGTDLVAFLKGLDALHTRLGLSLPQMRPPMFRCSDVVAGELRLHYLSERQGLAPFVMGLVEGLGERFGTPVTITLERPRGEGSDHDVFLVRWSA